MLPEGICGLAAEKSRITRVWRIDEALGADGMLSCFCRVWSLAALSQQLFRALQRHGSLNPVGALAAA